MDFYKLSLSWSRILPTGLPNYINEEGLDYYKNLLLNLKDNNIRAMVVMYNWDMPAKLHLIGGWINENVVKRYVEYAKIVINELGELVDFWLTIHDPYKICTQAEFDSGIHEYTCMHNILKAHSEIYHYYKNSTFKGCCCKSSITSKLTEFIYFILGKMSIDFHSFWYSALLPTTANKAAAERIMQFSLGWYANPIFSEGGDYPLVMQERVEERSLLEGRNVSRLPGFTLDDVEYIKGTADFFALSHFTSYIAHNKDEASYNETSLANDMRVNVIEHYFSSLSASDWLRVLFVLYKTEGVSFVTV